MFRKELLDVPGTDSLGDERLREIIAEANQRFEALSEEDQVLHLLSRRLSAVRECASTYEKQLSFARDVIALLYGPKFADRVLGDAATLKKLRLDVDSFTPPPEPMTTVVQAR